MIVLFTDFGLDGPYTGQMKAVLCRQAPGHPIIDLFADAPAFRPREAAFLLAAHVGPLPEDAVFLCVVDPGVGSARPPVAVRLDGRWFVGPGNGLFEPLIRRARIVETFAIVPADRLISASFHGRDLFAPVAARLSMGMAVERAGLHPAAIPRFADWPDDLPAIVYRDRYGNLMTGLRASHLPAEARLILQGRTLARARTFSDRPLNEAFWYENSNGLAEIAVNQGSAGETFGAGVGTPVAIA